MLATKFVTVLFASMPFLWSLALSQCPELTKPEIRRLTLDRLNANAPEGVKYESVEIHAYKINCLAVASTRGYDEALVTVNFTISDTGHTETFQMVLDCIMPTQEWQSLQSRDFDGGPLTAEEALNYETDVSCSSCHPTASSNTHPSFCTECPQCNVGLMACYRESGRQKCCNFYDADDNCLTKCGDNHQPDSDYTCVCSGTIGPSGECISPSIESVVITAHPGFQVELGEPLILTCTVNATGLDEIMWTRNRRDNTDIATNKSTGVSTLTIHAVSEADLGQYSCEAVAGSIVKNATAIITVNIPSESIESVEITAQPGFQVELGEQLVLTCTVVATGLEEIMWTRSRLDNTDIEEATNESTGISTLTIHAVSEADLGRYSCEAVAGSIVKNATAIITANTQRPMLVLELSATTVTAGEQLNVSCTATTATASRVLYIDGQSVVQRISADRLDTTTLAGEMTTTWTIDPVQGDDAGEYYCFAGGDQATHLDSPPQNVTVYPVKLKECTVQSPLTVIPNRTPGTIGASYKFHGTCEHILTAPCDSQEYKVVGDFLQTNLSTGRVGLVLPGYTVIIDEGLNLIQEGDKPGEVTAEETEDNVMITLFEGSDIILSIVRTDDQIVIRSAVHSSDLCGLCGNKDGLLNSSSGQRVTDIMDPIQIETFASSWKVEPSEQILREDRRECADIRSDTVIGDPLLQVPLWMKDSDETRSLCYEVHGRSDSYFNLVSDECIIVNALYAQMGDLNVVSEIGVRAVTKSKENCLAVKVAQVDDDVCAITLSFGNGTDVPMFVGQVYNQDGVQVRQQNQYRVRISVPNCEQVDLVMWATCEFNEGMPMMHFNISRGVNLRSTSHGLLGQFWNIPVTAEKVTDSALLGRLPEEYFNHDKIYKITVHPASSPVRTFFGELFDRHWDSYNSPCMYSGNSQAGPSGEMYGLDHSIIEGVYTDYIVSDIFNGDFPYNKFDDGKCSGSQ